MNWCTLKAAVSVSVDDRSDGNSVVRVILALPWLHRWVCLLTLSVFVCEWN